MTTIMFNKSLYKKIKAYFFHLYQNLIAYSNARNFQVRRIILFELKYKIYKIYISIFMNLRINLHSFIFTYDIISYITLNQVIHLKTGAKGCIASKKTRCGSI